MNNFRKNLTALKKFNNENIRGLKIQKKKNHFEILGTKRILFLKNFFQK